MTLLQRKRQAEDKLETLSSLCGMMGEKIKKSLQNPANPNLPCSKLQGCVQHGQNAGALNGLLCDVSAGCMATSIFLLVQFF